MIRPYLLFILICRTLVLQIKDRFMADFSISQHFESKNPVVSSPDEVDPWLLGWLKEAYAISV